MNFSAWAIRNPIAPILAFFMLMVLGWQSFKRPADHAVPEHRRSAGGRDGHPVGARHRPSSSRR